MLRTYKALTSTIKVAQPITLYQNSCKRFSFSRLIEDMEFRKKMRFDMMEANTKLKSQNKRFYERIYNKSYDNRKKIAIFLAFCVILNLHPIYKGSLQFARKLEPVKLQLKIWFLGEKNYIPDSIEETFMTREGIRISHTTNDTLSNLFVDTDRELKYGINKKFLRKLYAKVNCLKTKEDRAEFYDDSVYTQKLNQRLNGISLKQFLLMFQDMHKKLRRDESISEEELLKRVVDAWDEVKQQTKAWENAVMKKKSEVSKSHNQRYLEDRKKTIYQMLKDNTFISLQDLERGVIERGYPAMSIREKVKALEFQFSQLSQLKANSGLDRFSMSGESGNLERISEIDQNIARVAQDLKDAKSNFFKIFEKPSK